MRRGSPPPPSRKRALIAALLALSAAGAAACGASSAPAAEAKPNLLVVMTDDQTVGDLYARTRGPGPGKPLMPHTRALIRRAGVTFERSYASNPISCPSRATLLTGQYSFNHKIYSNVFPDGGFCSDRGRIDLRRSLPVWLRAAGYRTMHYGRFFNAWGRRRGAVVPPGWDRWVTATETPRNPAALFYGYRLNEDGEMRPRIGHPLRRSRSGYFTDVITAKAVDDLYQEGAGRPFFMLIDHRAPHEDLVDPIGPEPALRHLGTLRGKRLPRPPSFNERNVRDKAPYLRRSRQLVPRQLKVMRLRHRRRLESLRAVDDGVRVMVERLRAFGELDNTYVIFTSDNGFFYGEHRFSKGKRRPYEPSTRVPLLIRGPGIPAGAVSRELVSNADLAPTLLELAGATPNRLQDGRSLLPFATEPGRRTQRPILLESYFGRFGEAEYKTIGRIRGAAAGPTAVATADPTPQTWRAIVAGRWKLIRFGRSNFELYDLRRDPHELRSLARRPRYRGVVRVLNRRLKRLGRCRGAGCLRGVRPPARP